MLVLIFNKNKLSVCDGFWTGKEKVYFNKQCVSSMWSIGGKTHLFEDGDHKYEIDISLRWHCFGKSVVIRKNGSVIFTNK